MRQFVQNRGVHFRANAALLEQAEQVAQREGMSVSEFMRLALRRAVREAA